MNIYYNTNLPCAFRDFSKNSFAFVPLTCHTSVMNRKWILLVPKNVFYAVRNHHKILWFIIIQIECRSSGKSLFNLSPKFHKQQKKQRYWPVVWELPFSLLLKLNGIYFFTIDKRVNINVLAPILSSNIEY